MEKKILHISDLHLEDFSGEKEHLRSGFYKEYINEFVNSLGEEAKDVDFVLVTGDIVDRGKTENFIHARTIIDYLAQKLGVDKSKIGFSIGNHDYEYKKDDGSNSSALRADFYTFAKEYGNKDAIHIEDRFSLHKIAEDFYFMALDPTLDYGLDKRITDLLVKVKEDKKNETRNKPGKISIAEADRIIKVLQENVTSSAILIIGCHYPVEKFVNSTLNEEEDNFDGNHVWNQAASLRERINKIPSVATCWFFGDTHAPDGLIVKNVRYIMNGRFGTSVERSSQIPRQAKLLTVSESKSEICTISTFSKTHGDSATDVSWKLEKAKMRKISSADDEEEIVKENPPAEIEQEEATNIKLELINEEIECAILEKIGQNNLYSFGRFRTSQNSTSLGWVSINPLLNTGEILHSIIAKSKKRIVNLKLGADSTIIVGLEFWGAIIGSQVSIGTGIVNYCLATKGNGKFHSPSEINHDIIKAKLGNTTDVMLFIDVISCGETINRVIGEIETFRQELRQKEPIKYHVISVITDEKEFKQEHAKSISSFGTFCKKLKIPVINDDKLPDSSLVPYDVDLSQK